MPLVRRITRSRTDGTRVQEAEESMRAGGVVTGDVSAGCPIVGPGVDWEDGAMPSFPVALAMDATSAKLLQIIRLAARMIIVRNR